jgi:hypothetical protein
MDFDDWIDGLKQTLSDVEAGITSCNTSVGTLVVAAADERNAAADFSGATEIATDRRGRSYLCIQLAQDSQTDLVSLYHDIELVADWGWILDRAGIDPSRVFEPVSGDYGGGAGYRFEQTARLEILSSPGADTDVTPSGQAAFGVPVDVELLNNKSAGRLAFSVDLTTEGAQPAIIRPRIGHPPRLSSHQSLAQRIRTIVEDRAAMEIQRGLGDAVLVTPLLDILPQQPSFWCAWHDGLIRIGGRVRPRTRGRRDFIQALPVDFPVAVRFDFEILAENIRQKISEQGAQLFSGPTVVSDKVFVFVAGGSERRSLKIGCDVASATVTVKQNFRGEIKIRNNILVLIDVDPVGAPNVDVSIRPRIPLLTDWAEGIVKDIVDDKIPAINGISESFVIKGARRVDLWLSQDHVTLGLEPV